MKEKTKLHFVCRGNVYRSRLAEAYARSKLGDEWEVSSSGVDAQFQPIDFLSPWAKILCNEYGLSTYLTKQRTQTAANILHDKDIVIFMSQDVYDDAVKRYAFNPTKCIVWHIKDRQDWSNKYSLRDKRQKTYRKISREVNNLLHNIKHGGWVDVVNEQNEPLGYSLPISIATANAVWHRGCHAVITTPANKTLVQKRSKHIIFSPKLIDVSLGGHVDMSEKPETAMIREIQEELGIKVPKNSLKLLEIYRQSSYHPKYQKYTRSFIYTYHVPIPKNNPDIVMQKSEVASVKLLSRKQLQRLISQRQLKRVGKLNYPYAYYKRIVTASGVL